MKKRKKLPTKFLKVPVYYAETDEGNIYIDMESMEDTFWDKLKKLTSKFNTFVEAK
jgi:hypothetical protein